MRRTFGGAAGDVPITTDSPRPLSAGAESVALSEHVYIAPGYYDLTTTEGRERLGHEVAHVLQQRRGRDLPGRLGAGERAGLEAEADHAGQAFARGQPFAVQGRAPAQVALFKGAAPAKAPAATTTTIDLKAGGRIDPKPPAPDPAAGASTGGDPAAVPASGGKDKPKAKEQLIVSYGAVQASNPFTLERDDSGAAKRLTGSGTISLPASKYLKKLDLDISLGPDGYVVAKLKHSATTTVQIGGLEVRSGTLTAAIDHGLLSYTLDGANLALPNNIGEGSLSIQGNGDQDPAFDASIAINVPKMQPATMSFHADANGYRAEGSTGIDIKQAQGSVTFSLEKVGDDKALWSAAGTVGYNSERLSGQVSVQYNADGELSGEGNLDFQIADFLTGQATVAVDKEGHVTVNGEIRPPNETQLFPEKKVENTFFHHSVEFPIWGISIPTVGSVGIIAFIEGSMGYRVGVGAGVMRDIVLSGQYSTDPKVQPTFGITGEIFIPAFAELLISIGGGVKLDAFIADIGGGVKVDGRAGFYGGLSVRPTLAYEGGKYMLTGQAILGGDVGLQATLDAFVKLHVGKWMFSWEKEWDWKLGEWDKWLGLNLGMEADLDYTLGQPLSPDIFKLKKPDSLDVQGIAQSAIPKDGMPAQGPKGAQHEHEEFHAKGGGAAAPASGPAAQPKVAGTPAGAAGHKNQDPKGKTVKPGKPPKSGPPKKAKGKGPGQIGPNPKNNSKPTEPKLDATPIIEPFTMHGESHQLIVQLGAGGHVDMASKRERLSVKVGQAVSKLIAKHATPQQVADLKEIGALAKKGDKMVGTAKTHDKEGTTKAAHQIAAYGAKWEVKDLDEVAIKAPHVLVATHPVHLEKLPDALNKALGSAHNGQVIASKPGDPKEVTRQLLEKHADAHFDYASARLMLPALHAASLTSAHSADHLGQLLAQQAGVTKVSLKQSAEKGELKFELIGAIGEASAMLGTVVVDVVPHSLAMPHPVHLDKASEPLAKALGAAHSGQVIFHGSGDPRQATRELLQRHSDAHFDYPTGKLTLPAAQAGPLQAAHGVDQLGQLLAQQTGVYKVTLKRTEQKGELKFELTGAIGEATATLGTAVVDPLPHSLAVAQPVHLDKLSEPLAKALGSAQSGQVIFHSAGDPRPVTRQLLQRHSDAHFDFPTAKLTLPALHSAPLEAAHGVDQLGQLLAQQTGVSKVTLKRTEQKGELKFELTGAIGEATVTLGTAIVEPLAHSLVVPQPVHVEKLSEPLAKALGSVQSGQVIANDPGDPRQVTRQVLQRHSDAHFDFRTAKLTLPEPHSAPLEAAHSLEQLGQLLAQQTGVSKVTLKQTAQKGELKFEFVGAIGDATAMLGTVAATAGPSVAWWRETKSFRTTIEQHTLLFAGEGPEAQLQVHSVQRPLDAYVQRIRDLIKEERFKTKEAEYNAKLGAPVVPSDSRGDGDEATVSGIQQKLYVLKTRPKKEGGVENVYFGPGIGAEINKLLTAMADILATLPDPDTPATPPAVRPKSMIVGYGSLHVTQPIVGMSQVSEDGTSVEARVTSAPGSDVGSAAAHFSPLFQALKQGRDTQIAPGHILNHQLYGSGKIAENIAPIPKSANGAMSSGIEQHAQDLVFSKNKVINYKMTMIWPGSGEKPEGYSDLERAYPTHIKGSVQLYTFQIERFPTASQEELADAMGSWDNWTLGGVDKRFDHETERFLNPPTADRIQRYAEKYIEFKKTTPDKKKAWSDFCNGNGLWGQKNEEMRNDIKRRAEELASGRSEATESLE